MRAAALLPAFLLMVVTAFAQADKRLADRHALIAELHKAEDHAATIKAIELQLKEAAGTSWQDSVYRYTYMLGRAVWKSEDADAGLAAAEHLHPDWTLRGRVENLFDKEYVIADGYRTAERSFFLQLAWQAGAGE